MEKEFVIFVKTHYEGDRLDEFSQKAAFAVSTKDLRAAEKIVENAKEVFSEKYIDGEFDSADEIENFISAKLNEAGVAYRIVSVTEKDCYLY